jgi:hypothetical protein
MASRSTSFPDIDPRRLEESLRATPPALAKRFRKYQRCEVCLSTINEALYEVGKVWEKKQRALAFSRGAYTFES